VAGGPFNPTAFDLAEINRIVAMDVSTSGHGFTVEPSLEGHLPPLV